MRRSSAVNMLRLWCLMKVAAPPSLRWSIMLAMFWLAVWCVTGWLSARPDPQFLLMNIPLLAWYALAVLALAALLRWRSTPAPPLPVTFALAVGLIPIPLLTADVAAWYLPIRSLGVLYGIAAIYSVLYLTRGLRSLTGQSQRIAAVCGILFVIGFVAATDALDVIPDLWATPELDAPTASTDQTLADQEAILFDQSGRIDRLLAAIRIDKTPTSKAFFLGFAGVGDERVFAQEIGLASRVLGKRYAIGDRNLSLINDERDLDRAPLASVSALRYSLMELGKRMNLDRDVLFLAISSHGSQDPGIAVSNSQLPFNDMSDVDLAEALRQSGIKWRVIIISACYAGGFINSLKSPTTAIIAAAAADRTSFGCGTASDLTYFGEAFYRDALPDAQNLREAFDQAKRSIAVRERGERMESSKPQAYFGAQIEAKLASMRAPTP